MKPRLEVELAFIMGEDLSGPDVRIYAVMRATEMIVPAVEIIDYRTEVPRVIAAAAAFVLKGQNVLAGSFTRPVDIASGDVIQVDYGPLGSLGVSFL
jgi:2-oxo-hept-3-ene-1,7-dioate hydratase